LATETVESEADGSRSVIDYYSYQPRPVDLSTEGTCIRFLHNMFAVD